MTVELTPKGVKCNLSCGYCYQHPMRDAGNFGTEQDYDMEKMLAALQAEGSDFLIFGGEPLLVPIEDLRKIMQWGYDRYKKNGIQTNGVLITPEHVQLFKELNCHVGFSMDGPDELNDSRWAGTLERTRESTIKSHANMKACIGAGVATSVIITLYQGNATPERLPRLKQWIRELDTMGSRGVRIHLLEVDHELVRKRMQLSQARVIEVLRELVELEASLPSIRMDILTDMRKLLRADDDSVTCIWNPCDSYTTSAVRGVDGQGNRSNCGRTNKDGIIRLKADAAGFERQLMLYNAPQEHGGCKGCRFFLMCKGQCPGTAIDGDWRNRTADCRVWFSLFETLEQEMLAKGEKPLSLDVETRTRLEEGMLQVWATGRHISLRRGLAALKAGKPVMSAAYGTNNTEHGDTPHGDQHGDHTDHTDGAEHQDVSPKGTSPSVDPDHGDAHGDHTDHTDGSQHVDEGKKE